jgi:hypothetical protein
MNDDAAGVASGYIDGKRVAPMRFGHDSSSRRTDPVA